MDLRVVNLFSGSRGNATLVDDGTTRLLIDAGGTYKSIVDALGRLGLDVSQLTAVFITHEHTDHTGCLSVLSSHCGIPIHITERSARALPIEAGSTLEKCLVTHADEFVVGVGDLRVEGFAVPHDSRFCVGYRISTEKTAIGIVTDVGYITQRVYDRLYGCRAVMLEANHDCEMVKNGRYPAFLKKRILSESGHLSNSACAEFAAALARSGMRSLMLAHLSRENNTPEIAQSAVLSAVEPYGVRVAVASQEKETELFLDGVTEETEARVEESDRPIEAAVSR